MLVREIMTQPVATAREDASLEEVARLMLERNIGCVPVVDDAGRLVGLLTEADFMAKEKYVPFARLAAPKILGRWMPADHVERLYREARATPARDVMATEVVTASEDEIVADVVRRMLAHDLHRVPVVRDGVPVGILTRHDLLKLMV